MSISGGRGWWSTIEVLQGSRASETGSKHHPQARARWHSRPQSSICKYPNSLSSKPFPAKIHMLVRFCQVTFSVCDTFAMRFTCLWDSVESPSLFAIPLRCDAFVIPLRCELHRKDRYMAFWVAIVDTMGFVSQSFSMRRSALRKSGRRLEYILYAFFWPVVLWGQYKRYKRKIIDAEMNMGQEHAKEHLFAHVDALLVSGFGWDSIFVCVEIVFIWIKIFIYGVD